jgi:Leucine-rich repeat (LRR) protein
MPELKFLALFNNQITRVEKELMTCNKLEYFDVSNNLIEHIELESLPKSIQILNIQGNPVASQLQLEQVVKVLPKLILFNDKSLDSKQINIKDQQDLESFTAEKLEHSISKEGFANLRPLSSRSKIAITDKNYQTYDKEKFNRQYLPKEEQIEPEEIENSEAHGDENIREKNNAVYEQMALASKSWQLEQQQQLIQEIENMKELVKQRRLELTNQSRDRRKLMESMRMSREQMMADLLNNVNFLKSTVDKELE